MSSGRNGTLIEASWYQWSDALDAADYVMAHYEVTSHGEGADTAVRMAMEQSAAAMPIGS
jgi:hypothetical protein